MTQNVFDLDQMIKSRFRIFEGVRSQEEDEKLYDKILNLCLEEILVFLAEHASVEDREKILAKIKEQKDIKSRAKVLLGYLLQIKSVGILLSVRLGYFLDNLYFRSLENIPATN